MDRATYTPLNAIVLHAPKARSAPVITVHTTAEVEATREAIVLQECQEEEVSPEEVAGSGKVGEDGDQSSDRLRGMRGTCHWVVNEIGGNNK